MSSKKLSSRQFRRSNTAFLADKASTDAMSSISEIKTLNVCKAVLQREDAARPMERDSSLKRPQ
jgi:hypothetical protein